MNIFQNDKNIPLARRLIPRSFEDYEGQEHLVNSDKAIFMMAEKKQVQSMIFYGPPASGKTALAHLLSKIIEADFISINALILNSEDIKNIHQQALNNQQFGKKTVLFIDEIHRLTKPKQDSFLSSLEEGLIILIGATTENPYFVIQPALRSRLLIFEFFPLSQQHLKKILYRALTNDPILQKLNISLDAQAEEFLLNHSSDPRNMLTVLETAVLTKSGTNFHLSKEDIRNVIQKSDSTYDNINAHYDTISAFIKSIRGSDPDAALYYLAIMLESGEDPRFIFRRLIISAVEDIGLAYPEAISIVQSCAEAFEKIGLPEGNLLLSHATLLLAGLPKSNSNLAIYKAMESIKQGNMYPIPDHLKDASYQGAQELNRGIGYQYPHDYPEHFIKQNYTSEPVSFYQAQEIGFEKKIKERLEKLWNKKF